MFDQFDLQPLLDLQQLLQTSLGLRFYRLGCIKVDQDHPFQLPIQFSINQPDNLQIAFPLMPENQAEEPLQFRTDRGTYRLHQQMKFHLLLHQWIVEHLSQLRYLSPLCRECTHLLVNDTFRPFRLSKVQQSPGVTC